MDSQHNSYENYKIYCCIVFHNMYIKHFLSLFNDYIEICVQDALNKDDDSKQNENKKFENSISVQKKIRTKKTTL